MMTVVRAIHALTLILLMDLAPVASLAQNDAWERHVRAGISAYQQGNYDEAEEQYLAATKVATTSGTRDSRYPIALANPAELKRAQGKFSEAEELFQLSLSLHEEVSGREHPEVGNILNLFGEFYRDQGKFAKAEPMFKRSLAIREKHLVD